MPPGSDSGKLIRVVLADDQAEVRDALRNFLGRVGQFEIVGEAGDGAKAIDAVRETQPDAVLLDLAMPHMDGLQAIPEIRSASPDTKIVVLSSMVNFHDAGNLATSQGADAVFDKNTRPQELAAAIADLVLPE